MTIILTWISCAGCPTNITITPSSLTALFVGDVIACSLDDSPLASYEWIVSGYTDVHYGPFIAVRSPGTRSYTCKATVAEGSAPCQVAKTFAVTASVGGC